MASFEEKMAALESVVERLERGDLSLEESVRLFEEGMQLSSACKTELKTAEGRIQRLVDPESDRIRMASLEIEGDELDGEAEEEEDE